MGEIDWTFTPNPPAGVRKPAKKGAKKKAAKKKGATGSRSGKIRTTSPAEKKAVLAELQKLRSKYKATKK